MAERRKPLSAVTVGGQMTQLYYDGDGNRVKKVESKGGTTITTAYAGAIEVTITGTQQIAQAYYLAGAQRQSTEVGGEHKCWSISIPFVPLRNRQNRPRWWHRGRCQSRECAPVLVLV